MIMLCERFNANIGTAAATTHSQRTRFLTTCHADDAQHVSHLTSFSCWQASAGIRRASVASLPGEDVLLLPTTSSAMAATYGWARLPYGNFARAITHFFTAAWHLFSTTDDRPSHASRSDFCANDTVRGLQEDVFRHPSQAVYTLTYIRYILRRRRRAIYLCTAHNWHRRTQRGAEPGHVISIRLEDAHHIMPPRKRKWVG